MHVLPYLLWFVAASMPLEGDVIGGGMCRAGSGEGAPMDGNATSTHTQLSIRLG
jgi:hypothetical protein